ncbi:MAG: radical SAM protein [archaeon]|nr:radical SAM protein [archaeon]
MIQVNEKFGIPLFGLDFIGILGRGSNLLEIKPITVCNIKCKYCFVKSGQYMNNFVLDTRYILKWLDKALEIKENNGIDGKKLDDIEIHIAPYGEFFLYNNYLELIKGIRAFPQVKTISIQTNGLLLTDKIISELEEAGLTRLNISFNSLDEELARYLSGNQNYSVKKMLQIFDLVLNSSMDLLIAPIWFFGKNDNEIVKIIELAKSFEKRGFIGNKFRLGIQNYLIYKTGRKLKKVTEREFSYFYKRLSEFEKKYDIKLKLGPKDFNIHKSKPITTPVEFGEKVRVQVISEGRTKNEYIGVLNPMWAVKILSKIPLRIGSNIKVEIIKKKTKENLITAIFSH